MMILQILYDYLFFVTRGWCRRFERFPLIGELSAKMAHVLMTPIADRRACTYANVEKSSAQSSTGCQGHTLATQQAKLEACILFLGDHHQHREYFGAECLHTCELAQLTLHRHSTHLNFRVGNFAMN